MKNRLDFNGIEPILLLAVLTIAVLLLIFAFLPLIFKMTAVGVFLIGAYVIYKVIQKNLG